MQKLLHRRRNQLRLPGRDYSSAGAYFVTIVAQGRETLFDDVSLAEITRAAWLELAEHFSHVSLDEYVIMPNHLHGIVLLRNGRSSTTDATGRSRTAPTAIPPAKPLGRIVGAFKTMSSKRINLVRGTKGTQIWQRNFYERVIRSEVEMNRIREYIRNNPANWPSDANNPANPPVHALPGSR